jgi:hypothetical protein
MRRLTLFAIWIGVCAVPYAADVWDIKPYTDWSDKELDKVMTDSPWAGKAGLTHARQGASLGSVPDWDLVVAVRSALPFKQALVRREIGQGGAPTPQHEARLAAAEDHYVISIAGIPRAMTTQLQKVADATEIRRRGKEPIRATQGAVMTIDRNGLQVAENRAPGIRLAAQRGRGFGGGEDRSGITVTLVLGFPRTDAITPADNEFEVVTVLGNYNLKRTFKLKDMVFKGQLAL